MLTLRKSHERGSFDHGWLKTAHSFSFGHYYDPEHMGFRSLRVINEDYVEAGQGFGTHPHNDMEIFTYVLDGALEHKDSMGNGSVIKPGDVQIMSAGTGITHSEFNPSKDARTHLLQIWLLPEAKGLKPRYDQKHFSDEEKRDTLRRIISHTERDGAVKIFQDAEVFASILSGEKTLEYTLDEGRFGWVQVISGALTVNGQPLRAGDALKLADESDLTFTGEAGTHFLFFDLG